MTMMWSTGLWDLHVAKLFWVVGAGSWCFWKSYKGTKSKSILESLSLICPRWLVLCFCFKKLPLFLQVGMPWFRAFSLKKNQESDLDSWKMADTYVLTDCSCIFCLHPLLNVGTLGCTRNVTAPPPRKLDNSLMKPYFLGGVLALRRLPLDSHDWTKVTSEIPCRWFCTWLTPLPHVLPPMHSERRYWLIPTWEVRIVTWFERCLFPQLYMGL